MAAANPCCGYCKSDCSEELVSGWKLKDGSLAQLCRQCGFAYVNDTFCETFHIKTEGWRDCAICRKPLHCGCIISENKYTPLDLGGIGCSKCLSEVEQYYSSGPMTRLLNHLSDTVFKSKIDSLICSSPTENIVEPLDSEASKVQAPQIEEQPNAEASIGHSDTAVDANVGSETLQVDASVGFIPKEKVVDSFVELLRLTYPVETSCPVSFAIVETLDDTSVQNDVKKKRRGHPLGAKIKRKEKVMDLVAEPLRLTYPVETSCHASFGIVETLDDTSVHNDGKKKRRGRPLGSKTKRKEKVVNFVA